MTTVADVDMSTWVRQSASPIRDGSSPNSVRSGGYTPSADSRLIYVSATGNDDTGASTTIAAQTDAFDPQGAVIPYLTISAAIAQMRTGFPDWVLFKRGDTWTDQSFGENYTTDGRSASEPSLITYYGTSGDRPIFNTSGGGLNVGGGVCDYLTMYGVEFYQYQRDPDNPSYTALKPQGATAIRIVGGAKNFTMDDVKISFYGLNLNVTSFGGNSVTDLLLNRCIITNAYKHQASGYSQGVFIDQTAGITIQDCVIDNNGWNTDIPEAHKTQHNHNVYIQGGQDGSLLRVENNIISRSSAFGIHGRCGGLYKNNFFVECPQSLDFGYLGTTGAILSGVLAHSLDNVILNGLVMPSGVDTSSALWGIDIANDYDDAGGTVTIENTIIANQIGADNSVALKNIGSVTYTNNKIYQWRDQTAEAGWTHPGAGVPEYMATIGATQTLDAFLLAARDRGLGEWNVNYTASSVNDYIREGF